MLLSLLIMSAVMPSHRILVCVILASIYEDHDVITLGVGEEVSSR